VELPPDPFVLAGGTTEAKLAAAEEAIHFELPSDYRELLLRAGGGEGWISKACAAISSVDELVEAHNGYHADELYSDLVLIGTDRGGEAFAIERRSGRYVMTPYTGDETSVRVDAGATFAEFLAFIAGGAGLDA
jgi:hypothetical protein